MIGAVAASFAAGWAVERVWARRFDAEDPARDHRLDLPTDAEHRFLPTSDGGTMHVVSAGEGRPVILLHGITMRAEAWVYQMDRQLDARVIAVDLRGHGRSEPGTEGATLALCARDLCELLEALDVRDAVLVGHSLGGMTIGQFLADHRAVADERVAAYGLVATAGRLPFTLPGPLLALLADRLVRDAEVGGRWSRLRRVPRSDLGEWGVRQAFGRRPSRRHIDLVAASFEELPPTVYASLAASLLGFDALGAWATVDRPVAIAHGTRDRIVPFREAKRLRAAVPHASLLRLPGAGHLLMYERPNEIGRMVRDLISG